MNVALIDLFYANEEWAKLRRPGAVDFAKRRLAGLSKSLGDEPYLDRDRFTAGDLMMTTVLRILKHTDIITSDERLAAYIDRCTARPAFMRRTYLRGPTHADYEREIGFRVTVAGLPLCWKAFAAQGCAGGGLPVYSVDAASLRAHQPHICL